MSDQDFTHPTPRQVANADQNIAACREQINVLVAKVRRDELGQGQHPRPVSIGLLAAGAVADLSNTEEDMLPAAVGLIAVACEQLADAIDETEALRRDRAWEMERANEAARLSAEARDQADDLRRQIERLQEQVRTVEADRTGRDAWAVRLAMRHHAGYAADLVMDPYVAIKDALATLTAELEQARGERSRAVMAVELMQISVERANAGLAEERRLHAATRAELEQARTWPGLMAWLDGRYPVAVFPVEDDRSERDDGPRILSLVRRLAAAEATLALQRPVIDAARVVAERDLVLLVSEYGPYPEEIKDREALDALAAAALSAQTANRPTAHIYLSTACLHAREPGREDLHRDCQLDTRRYDGTHKHGASCKYCLPQGSGRCICTCHAEPMPGDQATPTEGAPDQTEKHTPYTDDGVTYCGWDGHDGCGEAWPCSTVRCTQTEEPS